MASGSETIGRRLDFGSTYVVSPKETQKATIVWLHGPFSEGSRWHQNLDTLSLRNVKWICPTAPIRTLDELGGVPGTAWFGEGDPSLNDPIDVEGLDATVSHIANLNLRNNIRSTGTAAAKRAASLPVFLGHGQSNFYDSGEDVGLGCKYEDIVRAARMKTPV
ncbi:acyl-protein thioesterase 1-like [Bidens hawaiensis]|uniref:acyl-protein thioesterase 1-like n=1 Tax=Bidens hawaiensis TaxID=980011 RepID=UPI004049012F